MIKKLIIAFLLTLPLHTFAIWQHSVINYSKKNYQSGAQNWESTQAANGWLYFANSNGLLEFNGLSWQSYPVKNKMVRSVKYYNERIYVGGSSEFGYFSYNGLGGLDYTRLSDGMRSDWGGDVWAIHLLDGIVYFQTEYNLIVYDPSKDVSDKPQLKEIVHNDKINGSAVIGKNIYITSSEGVFHVQGDAFVYNTASQLLKGEKVIDIVPYKNEMLLITNRKGVYQFDGHRVLLHPLSNLDFFKTNLIFSATCQDSTLVLGTVQGGVYIVNIERASYQNYNVSKQLQNNTVLGVMFDRDKNLWLSLDQGIDYIHLHSPLYQFSDLLIGSGYSSAYAPDGLLLATNQGVYCQTATRMSHLIPHTEGQSWQLYHYQTDLFCANDNALMVIDKSREQVTHRIDLTGVWQLCPYRSKPDMLLAIRYSGISLIKKENNVWRLSHHLVYKGKVANDSYRGMLEDDQNGDFWCMDPYKNIFRLRLSEDAGQIAEMKRYPTTDSSSTMISKVRQENVLVRRINGQITFCLSDGIYYYNRIKDRLERYTELEQLLQAKSTEVYDYLYQDRYNRIWFVSNNRLKLIENIHAPTILDIGLKDVLMDSYIEVNVVSEQIAIVNTSEGFVKIDFSEGLSESHQPSPFIYHVSVIPNDKSASRNLNTTLETTLPYSHDAIYFDFGATDFTHELDIKYTFCLHGFEKEWSIPSGISNKEYTALPEGEYVFEVKILINGQLTNTSALFSFEIQPPWFRTLAAYIVYLLLLIAGVYTFYRISLRRHQRIIEQKRKELAEQKERYLSETSIKDEQIDTLQNDKLMTELNFKTQQLTNLTLSMLRKNEALLDIKTKIQNVSKSIDSDAVVKRKLVQLINQINNSIEHDDDFDSFITNFDYLHQDFFKKLQNKFPSLIKSDQLLCAYIRMDFSSKEIAPLLNISVRGVEISRYRLRKKLEVSREVNLSEYLKNL